MDCLGYDAKDIATFWQDVAETGRYDEEPQTWAWREDLQRAIKLVRAKRPEILVAFGCADGCRDPEQLIKASQKIGCFIRKVLAIECTGRFEGPLRDRIAALGLEDRFAFLLNKPTADYETPQPETPQPRTSQSGASQPKRSRLPERRHAGR